MNFKPMNKKLVVTRTVVETKTPGGILIPDSAKERPSEGIVEAVADDVDPNLLGKKVIFGKYAGVEFKTEGKDFLLVNVEELFGFVCQ
jgi:chaperonin GroES